MEEKMLIFGPKGEKDLRRLHPGLDEEPEFKKLSKADMLFVWYFANKTSPFVEEQSVRKRAKLAYEASFGDRDPTQKERYIEQIFPEGVKEAIEKMSNFKPEERVRGLKMLYTIFNNLEKLVDVDVDKEFILLDDEGKQLGVDWAGREKFISSSHKVTGMLPDLIKQMEDGFGVVYATKDNYGLSGQKAIDRYHTNNKDK